MIIQVRSPEDCCRQMAFEQPMWKSKVRCWYAVITCVCILLSAVHTTDFKPSLILIKDDFSGCQNVNHILQSFIALCSPKWSDSIKVVQNLLSTKKKKKRKFFFLCIIIKETNKCVTDSIVTQQTFCPTIFSYLQKSDLLKITSKRKEKKERHLLLSCLLLATKIYHINLLSVIKIITENKWTVHYLCL